MIPLSELQLLLGATAAPQTDAVLTLLEEEAVGFVQLYTSDYFGPTEEFSEIIDGHGGRALWLSHLTLTVTSVSEGGWGGSGSLLIPGTDYMLTDGRRLFRKNAVWTFGREFEVTYDRGYDIDGDVPAVIRGAVLSLVRYKYALSLGGSAGGLFKSEVIGGYSYSLADASTAPTESGVGSVKDVLDLWMRAYA